jgi:hypothetical protein
MRYDYARYRTEARAWSAVEDMYATGEVSECEDPHVERRTFRTPGRDGYRNEARYVVTLRDTTYA